MPRRSRAQSDHYLVFRGSNIDGFAMIDGEWSVIVRVPDSAVESVFVECATAQTHKHDRFLESTKSSVAQLARPRILCCFSLENRFVDV